MSTSRIETVAELRRVLVGTVEFWERFPATAETGADALRRVVALLDDVAAPVPVTVPVPAAAAPLGSTDTPGPDRPDWAPAGRDSSAPIDLLRRVLDDLVAEVGADAAGRCLARFGSAVETARPDPAPSPGRLDRLRRDQDARARLVELQFEVEARELLATRRLAEERGDVEAVAGLGARFEDLVRRALLPEGRDAALGALTDSVPARTGQFSVDPVLVEPRPDPGPDLSPSGLRDLLVRAGRVPSALRLLSEAASRRDAPYAGRATLRELVRVAAVLADLSEADQDDEDGAGARPATAAEPTTPPTPAVRRGGLDEVRARVEAWWLAGRRGAEAPGPRGDESRIRAAAFGDVLDLVEEVAARPAETLSSVPAAESQRRGRPALDAEFRRLVADLRFEVEARGLLEEAAGRTATIPGILGARALDLVRRALLPEGREAAMRAVSEPPCEPDTAAPSVAAEPSSDDARLDVAAAWDVLGRIGRNVAVMSQLRSAGKDWPGVSIRGLVRDLVRAAESAARRSSDDEDGVAVPPALVVAPSSTPLRERLDELKKRFAGDLANAESEAAANASHHSPAAARAGVLREVCRLLAAATLGPELAPLQDRVRAFFEMVAGDDPTDLVERRDRFAEEAVELVQAHGMTLADLLAVVLYVYGRPVGEPAQEFGGTIVTLLGLAAWSGHDLLALAESDLLSSSQPDRVARFRAKRSRRHGRGPLPGLLPDPAATAGSGRTRPSAEVVTGLLRSCHAFVEMGAYGPDQASRIVGEFLEEHLFPSPRAEEGGSAELQPWRRARFGDQVELRAQDGSPVPAGVFEVSSVDRSSQEPALIEVVGPTFGSCYVRAERVVAVLPRREDVE